MSVVFEEMMLISPFLKLPVNILSITIQRPKFFFFEMFLVKDYFLLYNVGMFLTSNSSKVVLNLPSTDSQPLPKLVNEIPQYVLVWHQRGSIIANNSPTNGKAAYKPVPHHTARLQGDTLLMRSA